MDEHLTLNRANWDERVPLHLDSPDYDPARFDDPAFLSDVVRFDRPRLGDVHGLRGVHLQCHVGADTVSLARLGARMTGVDFSPPAIEAARALAARAGVAAEFVESDVDHAVEAAGAEAYDLVYTGIGALCWLPDIRRWADVVAGLLGPGGRLFLRESHPVLWSVDDGRDDALVICYPYFETAEPIEFDGDTSYVDSTATISATRTQEWNHGLGEIVGALLAAGLALTALEEHRTVPYLALPGLMERDGAEYRLREHPERLPLTYTLQAAKPAGLR